MATAEMGIGPGELDALSTGALPCMVCTVASVAEYEGVAGSPASIDILVTNHLVDL